MHKTGSLKNDITLMIAATNEACIEWLHENCYLMEKGITLLVGEGVNFLKWDFLFEGMNKFLAVV